MDARITKPFQIAFILFFVVNVAAALTNFWHLLYVDLPMDSTITAESFITARSGVLFYVHLSISYLVIVLAFSRLLFYLYKEGKKRKDWSLFNAFVLSIILGLFINIYHIFIHTLRLDPTYLFLSLIAFVLYYIIHKQDFNFALITTSRVHLLNKMREMYVIADDEDHIIEFSESILSHFDLKSAHIKTLSQFYKALSAHVILYEDMDELTSKYEPDKKYIHMYRQKLKVNQFDREGLFVLFYDETDNVQLMNAIKKAEQTDKMTGCFNRNYFESFLESYKKNPFPCGLVIVDVNHLKQINDILGHKAGDQLLIDFVTALKEASSQRESLIFRMGGDEFLYLEKNAKEETLIDLIEQTKTFFFKKELNQQVDFSYGIGVITKPTLFEKTYQDIDDKMYQHKSLNKPQRKGVLEYLKSVKKQTTDKG